MKDKTERDAIRLVILVIIIAVSYMGYFGYVCNKIKNENISLKQQLRTAQEAEPEQRTEYVEGQYTLITNLSSSIYLTKIPNNFENVYHWEDVNGVKGFDTVSGGLYLRYVEGHILWPQLALYAPEMHMEVISDTKWPKE